MEGLARRWRALLVATLILWFPLLTGAQTKLGPERDDLRALRGDVWHVITAPVRADRDAIVPALGAVGAIAIAVPFDSSIYAWMVAHPKSPLMRGIAPVRENFRIPIYELGSALYLIPISGALYAAGRLADERNVRDAGIGCMAAEVSSSALRVLIQLAVNRDRPRESVDPHHVSPFWNPRYKGHAFPSGHVANPMACASFVANRFELGAAEPAMFVYVAALALARIADGQHWASDVIGGSALGFAIGKALADRQQQRRSALGLSTPRRGPGVSIPVWSYRF
jgi:membrane-associated phospholipid phosphatase